MLRGHPWIFRTDVVRAQGITPGAGVRVPSLIVDRNDYTITKAIIGNRNVFSGY